MAEKKVTETFKKHEKDTGSSEVQIVGLSREIKELALHLESNKKDYSCRRSLLYKVQRRRTLLKYLKRTDEQVYIKVTDAFGLKR